MFERRTLVLFAIFALAASTGCGSAISASPDLAAVRGEGIDMWVVSDGERLPIFEVDGRHYLLGIEGRPYELWLTNRTEGRVEVVVSVDGRDVISGREADYRKDRGYVMQPGEELRVEGFRKSLQSVAGFEFSPISESYSARMGDGNNVGVIGIAVFEEKEPSERPRPVPIATDRRYPSTYNEAEASAPAGAGYAKAGQALTEEDAAEPGLGTKYGDDIGSDAEIVPFKRLDEESPAEVMVLYYDDREGLEAMGIEIPEEVAPRQDLCSGPNPFPGVECDAQFAPPPPALRVD